MSILDREDSVYITVRVGDGQCSTGYTEGGNYKESRHGTVDWRPSAETT